MVEGAEPQEVEKLRHIQDTNGPTDPKNTTQNAPAPRYRVILEPALIGAMMAINIGQTSLQNFYLQTACTVDLGYNISVCETMAKEDLSQRVVSQVNISRSFVGCLIATVVLLFIGPWSDCSGRRKPLLIMPLLGMSVMSTAVLLLVTFHGASTVQVLYAVQIPMSLGGNFGLLLAAAFSYIGDVCHATGRDVTRTMGAHRASIQVAQVLGAVSGPLLYRHLGFYGVFPIVLLLQVMSLLFVIFAVKDVNVNRDNDVSVFNWRLPVNAVRCLLKKRHGHRRKIILLMLVVALGDRMLLSAEVLLSYMFYRRKFGWDDVMFGSFLAYRNIVSFLGTLVILTVLKRGMRLSDECVGVVSVASHVLSASALMAARTTAIVFVLPVIGIIAQGSQVVQRPILNKQILPTEQGKIYSVMGALESATQTLSSPLYSYLYSRTVTSNPDAWIIPGIVLGLLQLASYTWARHLGKSTKYQKTVKTVELKEMGKAGEVDKLLLGKDVKVEEGVNKV
ncbi:hypothetical protein JYU34_004631 [Plutella xylostella]|uniref:Adenylate cyclase n=1 Tax=Plutella xylostella TaxID=51655 RepID=A0ABQ7QYI7_PLUXY|nr:hypothetical protein JYU34_004631 [Plutella xylostella]